MVVRDTNAIFAAIMQSSLSRDCAYSQSVLVCRNVLKLGYTKFNPCSACADAQSMPPALSAESDGSGRGSSESQHQRSDLLPKLSSTGLLRPLQRRASAPPGQLLNVMKPLTTTDIAELTGLLIVLQRDLKVQDIARSVITAACLPTLAEGIPQYRWVPPQPRWQDALLLSRNTGHAEFEMPEPRHMAMVGGVRKVRRSWS